MYLSATDFMAMFIAGSAMTLLMILLLIANYQLLKENRYLKERLRAWRKACATRHAEVPF
jgi:hypothetical protein